MSERFKAAWFDIDKTLIEDGLGISDAMVDALKRLPARGINTARGVIQAERVVRPTLVNLPSIVLAGGEVWEPGGNMIHSFPLSIEERQAVATIFNQSYAGIKVARFFPDGSRQGILYTANADIEARYKKIYVGTAVIGEFTRSIVHFTRLLERHRTSMVVIKPASSDAVELPEDLREHLAVRQNDPSEIGITKLGVNKGMTLLWLCNAIGIDLSGVLTAGDDAVTDTEVFKHTYGISVGETLLPYAKLHVRNPSELARLLREIFSP